MAIKAFNSISGYSVGDNGNIIIYANSDISTNTITSNVEIIGNNLTISGIADLGDVSNVKISGGSANYVLSTDGTGNLSWVENTGGNANVIIAALMPYFINTTEHYLVPNNRQGLFSVPIEIGDGTLEIDGILVEV